VKRLKLSLFLEITSLLTLPVQAEIIPCPNGKERITGGNDFPTVHVISDKNKEYLFSGKVPAGVSLKQALNNKQQARVGENIHGVELSCLYEPSHPAAAFRLLTETKNFKPCIVANDAFKCEE
jgi:hypothetical protein